MKGKLILLTLLSAGLLCVDLGQAQFHRQYIPPSASPSERSWAEWMNRMQEDAERRHLRREGVDPWQNPCAGITRNDAARRSCLETHGPGLLWGRPQGR